MPLYVDGVNIDDVRVDGVAMDTVYVDGNLVWTRFAGLWNGVNSITSTGSGFTTEVNQNTLRANPFTTGDLVGTVTCNTQGQFSGESSFTWGANRFTIFFQGSSSGLRVGYRNTDTSPDIKWSPYIPCDVVNGFGTAQVETPDLGGAQVGSQYVLQGNGFQLRFKTKFQGADREIGAYATIR